jgi:hypothetical protein
MKKHRLIKYIQTVLDNPDTIQAINAIKAEIFIVFSLP